LVEREQRGAGRDLLPAEQPLLQLIAARCVRLRIVEQLEPLLLLRLRGHRQVLDRLGVDLLAPVGVPDLPQQVPERETALHQELGEAERRRDFGDGPALLGQAHEGLVLGYLVGIEARKVLQERCLDGCRVVAGLHHGAGQRIDLAALLGNSLGGEVAPPSGDPGGGIARGRMRATGDHVPQRRTGMRRALALSTRFSVMPEPGKAMTPIGMASSIASLRLKGAAF
jgi:hypothetical protein